MHTELRNEERLVVLVDADLKHRFDNYIKDHGHTQKWMISYLMRELVKGKVDIKGRISTYRRER